MSQRKARPKLVAPPPPISHARQPTRFTASVTLFTADPGAHAHTEIDTRYTHRHQSPYKDVSIQTWRHTPRIPYRLTTKCIATRDKQQDTDIYIQVQTHTQMTHKSYQWVHKDIHTQREYRL